MFKVKVAILLSFNFVPYCFQHCKDTTINNTNKFICIFFICILFCSYQNHFIYLRTNLKEPQKMKTKPSDFTNQPMGSVLQKSEAETAARNIMIILKRTGDTFRELTADEYKAERIKDGNYDHFELHFFNMVIGYCKSPETAVLFSKAWQN